MQIKSSIQSPQRPKWWMLWVLVPLLVGMWFIENHYKLSSLQEKFLDVAEILLIYGSMGGWLWFYSNDLADQPTPYLLIDEELYHEKVVMIEEARIDERRVDLPNLSSNRLESLPPQNFSVAFPESAPMLQEIEEILAVEYQR